jgi:uncharacterized protein (TIGR02145 family)
LLLRPRAKFSVAAFLLAVLGVALLSCDTTSSSNASNIVSGRWVMDSIRMPDSATWTVHANAGTFNLGFPTDSSFSVTDTLPAPLGTDTLVIQAWTLSLRTTIANCWSDKAGNLTLYLPTTKDSLAIHLLLKLDSLRHISSATWGNRKDSKSTQIVSLVKAYANFILAGDTTFSRFPARHPVGIDTLAVIDNLLIQASATPMTVAALLQQLGTLDTAKVHTRARSLALAGQVDSMVLYPVISTPLAISGVPFDLELVEDSLTNIFLTVSGLTSDSATLRVVSADTSILASFRCTVHGLLDTLHFQAKSNAYGGAFKVSLALSEGVNRTVTTTVFATVASRNDAPTFGGASGVYVMSGTSKQTLPKWIDSVTPGPTNESIQKVTFEVQVQSGSDLFSCPPAVDSLGTLTFGGVTNQPGSAEIRVRARDDGDSTGTNVNISAWKRAIIMFNQAPKIVLPLHSISTWEGVAVAAGTAIVSDLETSAANLKVSWSVSDSVLLPHDSVFVSSSGSLRSIELRPSHHQWGAVKIAFSVVDSLGASAQDTLTLAVNPVNHAPKILTVMPNFVYSYKGEQSRRFGTLTWDDATTGQSGHVDVRWPDTQLVALWVDSSTGDLHAKPKVDTSMTVKFQVRAHDDGGIAYAGVDTGAWSDTISLQIVDTVLDDQKNVYRVARMPDGKVWMRSNFRSTGQTAPPPETTYTCFKSDCATHGVQYTEVQAFTYGATINAALYNVTAQGVCPPGWHMAARSEWTALFKAANSSTGTDSIYAFMSDTGWYAYTTKGSGAMPGGNKYGEFLYPSMNSGQFNTGVDIPYFWAPGEKSISAGAYTPGSSSFSAFSSTRATVRCVSD